MSTEMRILTVRQPYAWAIVHGGKDVENRTRNLAGEFRGPVAIHAGLQRDDRGWARSGAYRLTQTMGRGRPDALGAIIGVVDLVVVHHVTRSAHPDHPGTPLCWDGHTPSGELCSPWAESMFDGWHLVLANPRPLSEPIPYKGGLGLRRFNETVDAEILVTLRGLGGQFDA